MSIIGSEQAGQAVFTEFTRLGITVTGKLLTIGGKATTASLRAMLKLAHAGLTRLPGVPTNNPRGKMRLRTLQDISQGDLHAQPVSDHMVTKLKRDLNRRGINFSIEKGKDGNTYFHFTGKDVDSVRHAIAQVTAALNAAHPEQATPDQPDVKQPDVDEVDLDGVEVTWEDAPEATIDDTLADADMPGAHAPTVSELPLVDRALPDHMRTYLGAAARKQVEQSLAEATRRGWSVEQIHERLSYNPMPPTNELANPAGLVIHRVQDQLSTPPPTPTPGTGSPTPATGSQPARQGREDPDQPNSRHRGTQDPPTQQAATTTTPPAKKARDGKITAATLRADLSNRIDTKRAHGATTPKPPTPTLDRGMSR